MSTLERGERRRPHVETVRALSAALDLIRLHAGFAGAAVALKGDHAWAAPILGARDAVIERTGSRLSIPRCRTSGTAGTSGACTCRRGSVGPGVCGRATASIDALLKDIDDAVPTQLHRLRTTLGGRGSKMRQP